MQAKVKISPRFIGTCILVIIGVTFIGLVGWLQFGPENNVRMWLDNTTINQGDPVKLYMRNLGSKKIFYGYSYSVFRTYENGTIIRQKIGPANENWAFPAVGIESHFFDTFSQKIYTDYEPGDYYVVKEYSILDENNELKDVTYTRKLYFTIE